MSSSYYYAFLFELLAFLFAYKMSNDEIIDEESQEFEDSEVDESDDDESEEDESYIETLTRETVVEYKDRLGDYVDEPETPVETTQNESIKKFIVRRYVRGYWIPLWSTSTGLMIQTSLA